jgi:hypothetical protein
MILGYDLSRSGQAFGGRLRLGCIETLHVFNNATPKKNGPARDCSGKQSLTGHYGSEASGLPLPSGILLRSGGDTRTGKPQPDGLSRTTHTSSLRDPSASSRFPPLASSLKRAFSVACLFPFPEASPFRPSHQTLLIGVPGRVARFRRKGVANVVPESAEDAGVGVWKQTASALEGRSLAAQQGVQGKKAVNGRRTY